MKLSLPRSNDNDIRACVDVECVGENHLECLVGY